jgi:uncharacterized membrane protein YvbJ
MRFCIECGTSNVAEAKFCLRCGKKLAVAKLSQSPPLALKEAAKSLEMLIED